QLEVSARRAAAAESVEVDEDRTNGVANAAAASPTNTNDCFTRMNASGKVSASEPEPRAEARDAGRDDAGHEPERGTRLEIRAGRRRRVQHVEHIHVDLEPATAADREVLAPAEVQNVLRREVLAAVRLDANRRVAVLRDRGAAVRIRLAEDVRPLAQHAALALQEPGDAHVARQSIRAAHVAGPRPVLVEREELIVGAGENRCEPSVI